MTKKEEIDMAKLEEALREVKKPIRGWNTLLEYLSKKMGVSTSAINDSDAAYKLIKLVLKETKEKNTYIYTPKEEEESVPEKEEKKEAKEVPKNIRKECCLTCGNILTCPELLGYRCSKYSPRKVEADKEMLMSQYLNLQTQLKDIQTQMAFIENQLKLVKELPKKAVDVPVGLTEEEFQKMLTDCKMTDEEWNKLSKEIQEKMIKAVQKERDKTLPPISARNKKILKMLEKGIQPEQIATELKLEPKTVDAEINYLLEKGYIQLENKITGKKATLKQEGSKWVLVTPPT
jgi:ATP/maltotriose-dependent transcriptional regulator MalT